MTIQDFIMARIENLRQIEADLLAQVYAVQGAIAEYEKNLLPALNDGDSLTIDQFSQMIGGEGARGEIVEDER